MDQKKEKKQLFGWKAAKKYQSWQFSIKYLNKQKMQNIEFSLVKENIWSELDYEKIINFYPLDLEPHPPPRKSCFSSG